MNTEMAPEQTQIPQIPEQTTWISEAEVRPRNTSELIERIYNAEFAETIEPVNPATVLEVAKRVRDPYKAGEFLAAVVLKRAVYGEDSLTEYFEHHSIEDKLEVLNARKLPSIPNNASPNRRKALEVQRQALRTQQKIEKEKLENDLENTRKATEDFSETLTFVKSLSQILEEKYGTPDGRWNVAELSNLHDKVEEDYNRGRVLEALPNAASFANQPHQEAVVYATRVVLVALTEHQPLSNRQPVS